MNPNRDQQPTRSFIWQGIDGQGRPAKGQLQALNVGLVRAELRGLGLRDVQIQRVWLPRAPRITQKDLALMTRQLSALLRAGVPLLQAWGMLMRSLTSAPQIEILEHVHKDVSSGMALHEALAKHPHSFTGLYISMVQAGESAGILDTIMERLAKTLEQNEALRSRVHSALMYPCAVLAVAIAVLVLVLIFVVPVFEDVFKSFGAELPWATQLVVSLSQGLGAAAPFALLGVPVYVWVAQRPQASKDRLKARKDQWLLRLPVLGPLVGKSVVSRWAQTLSALLSAGVPMAEALKPVAQACNHAVFEHLTLQLQRQVAQGSRLSDGMARSGYFPIMLVQLCATGEETGAMHELLSRAGALMETEVQDSVNGLSSLLEPLIIVILGGLIGGILLAMYLPIFRMGQVY